MATTTMVYETVPDAVHALLTALDRATWAHHALVDARAAYQRAVADGLQELAAERRAAMVAAETESARLDRAALAARAAVTRTVARVQAARR